MRHSFFSGIDWQDVYDKKVAWDTIRWLKDCREVLFWGSSGLLSWFLPSSLRWRQRQTPDTLTRSSRPRPSPSLLRRNVSVLQPFKSNPRHNVDCFNPGRKCQMGYFCLSRSTQKSVYWSVSVWFLRPPHTDVQNQDPGAELFMSGTSAFLGANMMFRLFCRSCRVCVRLSVFKSAPQ